MIIVRDIFRLKFGQSKDATAHWKQAVEVMRKLGFGGSVRLLTDLVGGDYYTLVLESTFDSLPAWEKASLALRADKQWKAIYAKIIPLTETGRREILNVIE